MVLASILSVLPWANDGPTGAEALKEALKEPRTEVELYGIFREPHLNENGAETAVFPVTLYDSETGDVYGDSAVEFSIKTDKGRNRLERFLDSNGVEDVSNLGAIEGAEATIHRDPRGNINIDW